MTAFMFKIFPPFDGNFTQLSAVRTTTGTDSRRPFLVLSALS
jgi:hypothetical protein